jgi:hypothetical protein
VDAATKPTFESIRVNASYEEVMANARRFHDYARAKGTSFTFSYCLMRQNWHEFGDFCLMADSWDSPVWLNTVVQPPQFGIYTLPADELRRILVALEAQAPRMASSLKRNRPVWFGELERIRGRCAAGSAGGVPPRDEGEG